MDFSVDAGLFSGLALIILTFFFVVTGQTETYSAYNILIAFLSSSLLMFTSLIGLNAMVKGLAGPTSAIINTNAIVQIIMNAIFLNMIPTLM